MLPENQNKELITASGLIEGINIDEFIDRRKEDPVAVISSLIDTIRRRYPEFLEEIIASPELKAILSKWLTDNDLGEVKAINTGISKGADLTSAYEVINKLIEANPEADMIEIMRQYRKYCAGEDSIDSKYRNKVTGNRITHAKSGDLERIEREQLESKYSPEVLKIGREIQTQINKVKNHGAKVNKKGRNMGEKPLPKDLMNPGGTKAWSRRKPKKITKH